MIRPCTCPTTVRTYAGEGQVTSSRSFGKVKKDKSAFRPCMGGEEMRFESSLCACQSADIATWLTKDEPFSEGRVSLDSRLATRQLGPMTVRACCVRCMLRHMYRVAQPVSEARNGGVGIFYWSCPRSPPCATESSDMCQECLAHGGDPGTE
jgi:hypothetical protein